MARHLVEAFVSAARAAPSVDPWSPTALAILQADAPTRAAAAALLASELRGGLVEGFLKRFGREATKPPALRQLLARLLEADLPLTEAQLVTLLGVPAADLPVEALVRHLERFALLHGLPQGVRARLELLGRALPPADPPAQQLAAAQARLASAPALLVTPDAWGQQVLDWLAQLDEGAALAWGALLGHCTLSAGKPRPSAAWARRAAQLVAAVGAEAFSARLEGWLDAARLGPTSQPAWGPKLELGLSDHNQDVVKGLLWAAGGLGDPHLAHTVARFGERCFKKLPGFGPGSARLGNACVHALGAMPGGVGVALLSGLSGKVRYASGRRRLDDALETAAARTGQSREDLEELAVPDLGLDAAGARRVPLGDFVGELAVVGGDAVALRWLTPAGKAQASVPKAVKEGHPGELKALKRQARELEALLEGQAARLQRLWLAGRRLPLGALRARYLEHPVVGQLGRRLLWLVEAGGQRHELLWQGGRLAAVGGARVELPDDAQARLWHVLDAGALDGLLVWRDFADSVELKQPFAQLWREVYRPPDPAAHADRRFAGHLIRQHGLLNLCQQRGWRYTIQGHWDSANFPTLLLPRWSLMAVLEAEPVDHKRDEVFFNYLTVGGVQFFRTEGDGFAPTALPLSQVPPLVYSEVLRDVDLFIGASTVANEASFREADLNKSWRDAWRAWAWGELAPVAQTRGQLLARILPRTTLRDRARVEERWLVVQGPKEAFRIHLGTANVRRERDDQPLPVVADRQARERAARVFLPFEGDSMLGTILGKAFLLAADESGGGKW